MDIDKIKENNIQLAKALNAARSAVISLRHENQNMRWDLIEAEQRLQAANSKVSDLEIELVAFSDLNAKYLADLIECKEELMKLRRFKIECEKTNIDVEIPSNIEISGTETLLLHSTPLQIDSNSNSSIHNPSYLDDSIEPSTIINSPVTPRIIITSEKNIRPETPEIFKLINRSSKSGLLNIPKQSIGITTKSPRTSLKSNTPSIPATPVRARSTSLSRIVEMSSNITTGSPSTNRCSHNPLHSTSNKNQSVCSVNASINEHELSKIIDNSAISPKSVFMGLSNEQSPNSFRNSTNIQSPKTLQDSSVNHSKTTKVNRKPKKTKLTKKDEQTKDTTNKRFEQENSSNELNSSDDCIAKRRPTRRVAPTNLRDPFFNMKKRY